MSQKEIIKDRARSALLGVFPTKEAFRNFKESDLKFAPESISKFFDFAEINSLMATSSEKSEEKREAAFLEFIDLNSLKATSESAPPEEFTFSDFLQYELKTNTKVKSVHDLIEQLNSIAQRLGMETPQASMVSRLKKDYVLNTPQKRNLIRLLSFWVGENVPHLGWNFETFSKLPRDKFQETKKEEKEKEGVRLCFFVQGNEEAAWVKNELKACINDLNLPHINTHKIITFERIISLDLPKEKGEAGEPRLYSKAIQKAISIAHQMYSRWFLLNTKRSGSLNIFITAGIFENLKSYLPPQIIASSSNSADIKISEFAKICVRLSDIKVILGKTPEKVDFYGNTLVFWPIEGFWFQYYDYIPCLLEEDFLPKHRSSYPIFKKALYFPDQKIKCKNKALHVLNKSPHNAILLLEMAKVCINRRMFHEANEILSKVLAANQLDVVARTMRVRLLMNLAISYKNYSISKLYFDQAVLEGKLVETSCTIEDEEFFCEFGLLYLSMSFNILNIIRNKKGDIKSDIVFELLKEAEYYFRKAASFSPSGKGHRSIFWLTQTLCARKILKSNPVYFESKCNFVDTHNVYYDIVKEIFILLGWIYGNDYTEDFREEEILFFLDRSLAAIESFKNTLDLRTSGPNIMFSFAVASFDTIFCLYPKSFILKYVLNLLEDAKRHAINLDHDTDSIYPVAAPFIQFHEVDFFISYIDNIFKTLNKKLKDNNIDLDKMDDNEIIDMDIFGGLKLMFFDIDYNESTHILLKEG